jgi:hypothetical protein
MSRLTTSEAVCARDKPLGKKKALAIARQRLS